MGDSVKYAYVRYLKDNVKDIVPIEYFKNFVPDPTHANDFETAKAYLARWSGDDTESDCEKVFYKAQILMLGGSKDDVVKRKALSRVRVPKVFDTSVEESSSSSDEDSSKSICKETTKIRKERKDLQLKSQQQSLKGVIEAKMAKKRASLLFGEPSSSDTGCNRAECVARVKNAKRKCREAESRAMDLQKELDELKESSTTTQQLNIQLQQELLQKLCRQSQEMTTSRKTPKQAAHVPVIHVSDDGDDDSSPGVSNPKYFEVDGKISLGAGISVYKDQWEALKGQPKHSLFVKGLAVATWGRQSSNSVQWREKCVTVSRTTGRRGNHSVQKKLSVLKDCFMDRLKEKRASNEEVEQEASKFKKYIAEKIQDINRVMRKQKE